MKPVFRLLIAALLIAALPLNGASAETDHTGTAVLGTPFEWTGNPATGTAFGNFIGGTGPVPELVCSKDPTSYCETALVAFDLTLTQEEIDAGKIRKRGTATIEIGNPTVPAYDYDLIVYDSDAEGTKGAQLATSGALDETPGEESVSLSIAGTLAEPIDYYLVEIVYFYAVQGSYDGAATVLSARAS